MGCRMKRRSDTDDELAETSTCSMTARRYVRCSPVVVYIVARLGLECHLVCKRLPCVFLRDSLLCLCHSHGRDIRAALSPALVNLSGFSFFFQAEDGIRDA